MSACGFDETSRKFGLFAPLALLAFSRGEEFRTNRRRSHGGLDRFDEFVERTNECRARVPFCRRSPSLVPLGAALDRHGNSSRYESSSKAHATKELSQLSPTTTPTLRLLS